MEEHRVILLETGRTIRPSSLAARAVKVFVAVMPGLSSETVATIPRSLAWPNQQILDEIRLLGGSCLPLLARMAV